MHVIFVILLILHIVGIGSLLGGFLTQMKQLKPGTAVINPAMLHGALTMLVTGLLMVGVGELGGHGDDINLIKMGVKTLILIAVFVLILLNRKKERVATPVIGVIGLLTIANIAIAVAWS